MVLPVATGLILAAFANNSSRSPVTNSVIHPRLPGPSLSPQLAEAALALQTSLKRCPHTSSTKAWGKLWTSSVGTIQGARNLLRQRDLYQRAGSFGVPRWVKNFAEIKKNKSAAEKAVLGGKEGTAGIDAELTKTQEEEGYFWYQLSEKREEPCWGTSSHRHASNDSSKLIANVLDSPAEVTTAHIGVPQTREPSPGPDAGAPARLPTKATKSKISHAEFVRTIEATLTDGWTEVAVWYFHLLFSPGRGEQKMAELEQSTAGKIVNAADDLSRVDEIFRMEEEVGMHPSPMVCGRFYCM